MVDQIDCRLQEILDSRGIEQEWLCKQVGISSSAMKRIVKGESEPTFLTALKISEALDLVTNSIWSLKKESGAAS
ncbi:helix-turn-helix transcriptional regulator [Paenibacillus ginsengarvi]|jgi:DNA-binding XRE family transcriptional regulator|uniref:XRE family transcriptional regulator n=1 Tax=Paenibacillus ginsengarvi TaxID=400777 RepID=A0A3B0CN15_9BACL|nr:helix-turn-helix transcriptional regulator [Paenibacillus ginsengarvi]RKN86572.1 XRE family transcriptional regulator [Paenibacillus ginsengarvi]